MAELTDEMSRVLAQCAGAVLITLRQHYPTKQADQLYCTFIARSYVEMIEQNPLMLDTLIETFNDTIQAPVQMARRVQ